MIKSGFFFFSFAFEMPCWNRLLGRKGHFKEAAFRSITTTALLKAAFAAAHWSKKKEKKSEKS